MLRFLLYSQSDCTWYVSLPVPLTKNMYAQTVGGSHDFICWYINTLGPLQGFSRGVVLLKDTHTHTHSNMHYSIIKKDPL